MSEILLEELNAISNSFELTKKNLQLFIEKAKHLNSKFFYDSMLKINFEYHSGEDRDLYQLKNDAGVIVEVKSNKYFGCRPKILNWGNLS